MHQNKHNWMEDNKNPKTTHLVVPTCWHVPIHLVTHVNSGMGTPYDKFKLIPKSRPMDMIVLNFFWIVLGESWFVLWYPNHECTLRPMLPTMLSTNGDIRTCSKESSHNVKYFIFSNQSLHQFYENERKYTFISSTLPTLT
jgi:hypothetical protein